MIDFVYNPVSAILWLWHTVSGALLDPASGIAWALSVAFWCAPCAPSCSPLRSCKVGRTRQRDLAESTPQTAIMNRLMLWVFPLGVLVGGAFLPGATLVYWLSNNAWTLAQQHVVMRTLDREQTPGGARPGDNEEGNSLKFCRPAARRKGAHPWVFAARCPAEPPR